MYRPYDGSIRVFCQRKEFKTKKNKETAGIVYKQAADKPKRPGSDNVGYVGPLYFGVVV